MTEKVQIEELAGPSTSLLDGVEVVKRGRTITLSFALDLEESIGHYSLTATNVQAHAHHTEAACSLWHLTDTYDTVCEVRGSRWAEEVSAVVKKHTSSKEPLRHFIIFFDSEGCFEFIADDCRLSTTPPKTVLKGF